MKEGELLSNGYITTSVALRKMKIWVVRIRTLKTENSINLMFQHLKASAASSIAIWNKKHAGAKGQRKTVYDSV